MIRKSGPIEYWQVTFLTAGGKYRTCWVTGRKGMPGNIVWYVVVKADGEHTRERLLCSQDEVSERHACMNNKYCELELVG